MQVHFKLYVFLRLCKSFRSFPHLHIVRPYLFQGAGEWRAPAQFPIQMSSSLPFKWTQVTASWHCSRRLGPLSHTLPRSLSLGCAHSTSNFIVWFVRLWVHAFALFLSHLWALRVEHQRKPCTLRAFGQVETLESWFDLHPTLRGSSSGIFNVHTCPT